MESRLRFSLKWVVVLLCCLTLGLPDHAATSPLGGPLSASDVKRRAEANTLRKRIAKGNPSARTFWRDVKRLEALGPTGVKIAVIQHPGAVVLYSYRNVNGLAIADDHVVLGPYARVQAEQAFLRGDAPAGTAFAVVTRERSDWWPNGIVPFEIDSGLEDEAQDAVNVVIADYRRLTPVRLRERNGEEQYVRFVKQLPVFSSMTDHIGRGGGRNEVKIQTRNGAGELLQPALLERSVRHELGHALGMYHEHNRKDRDDFVRIDEECLDFWYSISGNFSIEKESTNIGPYDFSSIMHYPSTRRTKGDFWDPQPCFTMVKRVRHREPGDDTGEIAPNSVLSKHDVNAMHHMYGRNGVDGMVGDDFGSALLVHNFDTHPGNDDLADLAIGAPGVANGRGSVFLYKWSATGFVLWKILVPSSAEAGQRFGQTLAAGDFDGDGVQDLAVGAPHATVNGKASAGKVYLFRIRGNRDVDELEVITKPDADNAVEVMDRFGHALAAGLFFDRQTTEPRRRHQLAIGAPGARNGAQGRVGRVWVSNTALEPRMREVAVTGDGTPKFGQFGFALATMVDRPTPGIAPRDRLIAAAPGVTLGGCGSPTVFTTRLTITGVQTLGALTMPDASPGQFCPQDPNLSDAIDAFPNPVWDATFGSRLTSGDFDGDGLADLAVAGAGRAHLYLVTPQGSFMLTKTMSNRDFGEPSVELSFGIGLAAGDLDGDGLAELVVGAPLVAAGSLQSVGRAYVYRGCRPVVLDAAGRPRLPPRVRAVPGATDVLRKFCLGGLRPWFTANQTDFQSQSLTIDQGGPLGTPTGNPQPRYPPFTDNRANDRFGTALAVVPPSEDTGVRLMIASPPKVLGNQSGGAVFQFAVSVTSDAPPFRNTLRSWTLTPSFSTRLSRE